MALSGLSYQYANGDGATKVFSFTFKFLEETVVVSSDPKGILVYVGDVKQTSGYTIDTSAKTVTFTVAPASGSNNIKIERSTPQATSDRLVDFTDGAVLSESDLETNQLQQLYISQEAHEKYEGGDISGGSLSADKLADDTITAAHLAANSVGTSEIQNDAVTADKIAPGTIIESDLSDDSVSFAKLDSSGFVSAPGGGQDHFIRIAAASGNLSTGAITPSDMAAFNSTVQGNRLDQMTAPTGPVSFNSQKITSLADPAAAQDAATKAYVDGLSGFIVGSATESMSVATLDYGHGTSTLTCLTTALPSGIAVLTNIWWSVETLAGTGTHNLSDSDAPQAITSKVLVDGAAVPNRAVAPTVDPVGSSSAPETSSSPLLAVFTDEGGDWATWQGTATGYGQVLTNLTGVSGDNLTIQLYWEPGVDGGADNSEESTIATSSSIWFAYIPE